MSKDGPVSEDERGHRDPIVAETFSLTVSREGWIGITFHKGESEFGPFALEPGLADLLHDYLSPKKRTELWEMARAELDKGLN